jgi:drug/metabolite transporter (DMT)-like permease
MSKTESTITRVTEPSKDRFWVVVVAFMAVALTVFSIVVLGVRHHAQLTSFFAGMVLVGVAGIAITFIEVLRAHTRGELSRSMMATVFKFYMTILFIMTALAEVLKKM